MESAHWPTPTRSKSATNSPNRERPRERDEIARTGKVVAASSGLSWMSAARDGGCAPCARLIEAGGVNEACVGSAGGYGGFYCFDYKP